MLYRLIAVFLFTCFLADAHSAAKAQQQILEEDGPYKIFLITQSQNGPFEAAVQYESGGLMTNYSGDCQASAEVTLLVLDGNLILAHQRSGNVKDLKAEGLAKRMSQLLERACPVIETVAFKLSHIPDSPTVLTLRKSLGWTADSAPAIKTEKRLRLSEIAKSLQLPDGINCVAPADIFIDSSSVTTISGRPSNKLRDYRSMAETSAKIYSLMCPQTEIIRFYPASMPDEVTCELGKGECHLLVTRNPNAPPAQTYSNAPRGSAEERSARLQAMVNLRAGSEDWTVKYVGYEGIKREDKPSIETFAVLIDLLVDGDYSLIRDTYQNYFKLFHNQFLFAYSDKCSRFISDPEIILITPYEETVYGDGTRSGRRQTAPTSPLTLSKERKADYMRYDGQVELWLTRRMFSDTINVRNIEDRPNVAGNLYGTLMSDKGRIDTLLGNGCQDARVQAVYKSLGEVL